MMRRALRTRLRRIAAVCFICLCIWVASRYQLLPAAFNSGNPSSAAHRASAEYFAATLKISMRVVRNVKSLYDGRQLREVTISNPGAVQFPASGWQIYFTQIYMPELGKINNVGIEVKHVQGQLYKFSPLPDLRSIPAGGELSFTYYSAGSSLAYTDSFPNWYIIYKDSKPFVLESTRGDPAKFSQVHDTPEAWKANNDPNSYLFDHHNPPSSADRFVRDSAQDLSHDPLLVVPTPLDVSQLSREVSLNMHQGLWVIIGESTFHNEMQFLAKAWQLKISAGGPPSHYIKFSKEDATAILSQNVEGNLNLDEAYGIDVSPSTNIITITASKSVGAFYAVQSLIALRNKEGKLPSITISDAPRFKYRGLMLDIARNFHSKEAIKRYIHLMSMYKLNKLHLHLTDDEGWRIEIPGLEELTSIGGRRCHDLTEKRCLLPFLGSGPGTNSSGTGYLSVKEYKEILSFAVKHHIEVIPEVDVPGHAHAAVIAMKRRYINTGSDKYLLNDPNDKTVYKSIQGFTDNAINPCLNSTYAFLHKVISEIYNMHKGISPLSMFHIGGDEVPDSAWRNSPACRHLTVLSENFSMKKYFIQRLSKILQSLQLDIAAWEDGFKERGDDNISREMFPQKNVYSYSWKNPPHMNLLKSAYTMANSGYKVVLASATNLYLDHPYESDPAERGLVWATRFISTKRSFSYSPLNLYSSTNVDIRGMQVQKCVENPFDCPGLNSPDNIEGIEAILFGELTTSVDIIDYMLLPRLLAVAERAWHEANWEKLPVGPERKAALNADWTKFANTLGYRELPRLDRLEYRYRIPPPGAILDSSKLRMIVNVTYPGHAVEISRNGGWGWAEILESSTRVNFGEKILLRTRAGIRTSKPILFNAKRMLTLNDS